MPYGMAVLYSFLKEHRIPVVQHDFLMEYLFQSEEDVDFHDSARTFTEQDFFSVLAGNRSHPGLAAFARKYGEKITKEAVVYGFSIVAYHQFWASLLLTKHIKDVNPRAVVVFGGPFITIRPANSFVAYGQADYWVKGSGEIPLLLIYKMVTEDRSIDRDKIPGLIYLEGDHIHSAPRSVLCAEEERPPDFEGLSLNAYKYDHAVVGKETLFLPYRVSKGCPSQCSFCTGRLVDHYSLKSTEKIVSEVKALGEKYGTTSFQFADASINGNPESLGKLCDAFSEAFPDLRWYSYAKVNGFSSRLLDKAKKSGCFSLFWGVESAHQPTIELLGKRFDVRNMYDLLDHAIDLGIKNYIHLIYNTPHESVADIEAFRRLIERYINCREVVFLPQRFLLEAHSLMHEHPERYGLADIRKVPTGVFEREQYTYQESEGPDYADIVRRNKTHLVMLAAHLESARYRMIIDGSRRKMARYMSPMALVSLKHCGDRSRLARAIHGNIMDWLADGNRTFREQL